MKEEANTGKQIALVLLAAGAGRRFGSNKLLAEIDGKPMYRHLADELAALPDETFCRRLVVSQYPQILKDLGTCGYGTIENCRTELGISHSVRLAVLALNEWESSGDPGAHWDGVCFAVCDQPWLKGSTIMRLIREWSVKDKGLGCLCFGERDGNPAVFSRRYEKELLSLTGDVGGRAIIRRHPEDLYRCEAENEKELEDVDVAWKASDSEKNASAV